ncbi:MAG: S-adenosylmethionine decarboxylase [Gemmatimonadetes bacterium]|nr:S-adenosylmethionine decarboxylase [Gemmatimonadota bacterium]
MLGQEWIIEARGADSARLRDHTALAGLFTTLVREMGLTPVSDAAWHQFPEPGGVTGVQMLAESHLAVHTFPEFGSLCLNVFCCRPRAEFDFAAATRAAVGAAVVQVRCLERGYGPEGAQRGARTTPVSVRVIRAE